MTRIFIMSYLLAMLQSCATTGESPRSDFAQHRPRSILVLPPVNESNAVGASAALLSVLPEPIAEKGYYVFPVGVMQQFFRQNGLDQPREISDVAHSRLRKVFGADAVLYVTIQDWGTKYLIFDSVTVVEYRARLVDLHSGTILWDERLSAQDDSIDIDDDLTTALASAVVGQLVGSLADSPRELAKGETYQLIHDPRRGFIDGPLKPPSGSEP